MKYKILSAVLALTIIVMSSCMPNEKADVLETVHSVSDSLMINIITTPENTEKKLSASNTESEDEYTSESIRKIETQTEKQVFDPITVKKETEETINTTTIQTTEVQQISKEEKSVIETQITDNTDEKITEQTLELNSEKDGTNDELNPIFLKMQKITFQYYRNVLSVGEKKIYDAILKFYSNPDKYYLADNPYKSDYYSQETMTEFSYNISRIMKYVWADNYYISQDLSNLLQFGYSESDNKFVFIKKEDILPGQRAVSENYKDYLDRLEIAYSKAEKIAENVPSDITTQRDIALYFHDYIINNAAANAYGTTYLNNEAYGALIEKAATCEGFTNAFSLLCGIKGIDSVGVFYMGKNKNDIGHIWNLVSLDGVFTYIDVFHDNVVYKNGDEDIRYDYFGMSDEVLTEKLKNSDRNYIDEHIASVIPKCQYVSID